MLKRTSKEKDDLNELAVSIVEKAVGAEIRQKNQAAVELGRLGGLKGGNARAAKLSPQKRKEIAKKAAKTRWEKARAK